MQKSSKTIVEIPAGGFYVYNPKKQPDVIPTSDGAFGCCYLTIKDGDNILVAHINATSIMLDSVAKKTVQNMLTAFKNAGGEIENAETIIIHSNDPQEYEQGFKNRPKDLTKDQWERRGHYSERLEDNEKYPYVAEPFAHVALQKALENAGVKNIKSNKENFNSNLGEFMSNGNAPAIKTDIIIGSNGETYLRNVAHDFNNDNKEAIKHSQNGAEEVFKQVEILSEDKINNRTFKPSWQETPPVGKFYVNVANDIEKGLISVENSIGTTKEGCQDYSQFAAMDMNKYVENKLKPQFMGPQGAVMKAMDGTLVMNSVVMVNPNEVYQDKVLISTSDESKIGNPNDIAYMASIGKILTAKTVVEYFKGNLEIKIAELLKNYPEGKSKFIDNLKHLPHYKEITLAHLLNHTAGLPQFSQKGFDNLNRKNGEYLSSEDILSHELDNNPNIEFSKHNYSNVGYELAGLILENQSGSSLEELQREIVLKPAGLENEIFLRDDLEEGKNGDFYIKNHPEKNLLLGQHFDGKKVNKLPNLSHHAGAGIYANPKSIAKLAEKIWTKENIELLQKYESEIPNSNGAKYGIGYIRNQDTINHDGGMDGTRSSVMLNLTTGKAACAVATLENLTPKLAPRIDEVGPEKHYEAIQKLRLMPQRKLIELLLSESQNQLQTSHEQEFKSLSKLIKGDENPANWANICFKNLDEIHTYVQKNGWNFDSPQSEMAAFLMTQHGDAGLFGFIKDGSIDTENSQLHTIIAKQRFILDAIKSSDNYKQNNTSTKLISAFVEDRILRNECKEQKYGTQRLFKNTPIYPKNVDENRNSIGFKETCKEYHLRTEKDPLTYKEILDNNKEMKEYITKLELNKEEARVVNTLQKQTSFIQKLEPHYEQPTISSLMKAGLEYKALERASNMKSQKSFVKALEERRSTEEKQSKGNSK